MNTSQPSDDRLIAYLCNELDAPQRAVLEKEVVEDADLRDRLSRWRASMAAVTPVVLSSVPAGFDQQLLANLEAVARGYQLGEQHLNQQHRLPIARWMKALAPIAAAAIVVVGVLL